MDEERRTSANLAACIAAARHRIVFINTGFLDRTGDEIHTCMEAGPVLPKEAGQDPALDPRLREAQRADRPGHGLLRHARRSARACGPCPTAWPTCCTRKSRASAGRRQHGVGALTHRGRAACAALPSRRRARRAARACRPAPRLAPTHLLTPPLATDCRCRTRMQRELDNNIQGILGYVVRWIEQGVGCSKVPDIHDIGPDGRPRHAAHFQPARGQLAAPWRVLRGAGARRRWRAWPEWSTSRMPAMRQLSTDVTRA